MNDGVINRAATLRKKHLGGESGMNDNQYSSRMAIYFRQSGAENRAEFEEAVNARASKLNLGNGVGATAKSAPAPTEYQPMRATKAVASNDGTLSGLIPGALYVVVDLPPNHKVVANPPANIGTTSPSRRKSVSITGFFDPVDPAVVAQEIAKEEAELAAEVAQETPQPAPKKKAKKKGAAKKKVKRRPPPSA